MSIHMSTIWMVIHDILPMWQCISQVPGLSDLKAMTMNPFTGKSTTSRRGGLDSVKLSLSGEYFWVDC